MALPNPEPGLVVCYSYLWHDEHIAGRDEGLKSRPSVIVLAVEREIDGATLVTVLPITHSAPQDPKGAVEIPPRVKRHLGLDGERSWIIVSEGNEFVWPGYDLHKRAHSNRYDYGVLPGRMFDQVRTAFLEWIKAARARTTSRD